MKIEPIKTYNNFIRVAQAKTIRPRLYNQTPSQKAGYNVFSSVINLAAKIFSINKKQTNPEIIETEELLLNHGFKKQKNGNLKKNFTLKEKNELKETLGRFYLDTKLILDKPLDKKKVEAFKNFIEINKEESKKLIEKNFNKLFTVFSVLSSNYNLVKFQIRSNENKNYFEFIKNFVNSTITPNELKSFYRYKNTGYIGINKVLRSGAKNNEWINNDIKTISKYLDTQILPENVKLYRGESAKFLNKLKLENGETVKLGDMIADASRSKKPEDIEKVKEFILDNEITGKITCCFIPISCC